jgi:TolB protein
LSIVAVFEDRVCHAEEVDKGPEFIAMRGAPGKYRSGARAMSQSWLRAVICLVCALGVGCCAGVVPEAPTTPGALGRAVQVTHGGYDSPSFAPDGRRVAVLSLASGHEQLAIMNRDGGEVRALTGEAFDHEDPAWSPDGQWIAYIAKADGGEVLHLIRPDGTGDVALTPATQKVIHPSWSPDSRTLLYCTDDDLAPPAKNDSEIWAMNIATHAAHALITGGVNTYPILSPDGRTLAFRRMVDETNSEVWLADGDGSHPRNLTNNPAFDGWPAWSPDGRRLSFGSNRDGNYRIYIMDADGANARLLADTSGRATYPRWTPDGTAIWFPICQRIPGQPVCEIYSVALPRR